MSRVLGKRQTVSATEPVLVPFYRIFSVNTSKTVTEELIIYDSNRAPGTFSSAPRAFTRIACTMPVNLNSVPKKHWQEKCNSKGDSHQYLELHIRMQLESGGLRFDSRVVGVFYGKVTATLL